MSVDIKKDLKLPEIKTGEFTNSNIDKNKSNFNTLNNKTIPTSCLYTRKMDEEEKAKGEITNLIYKSFNDPDYYFSEKSPIKVNSKINLKNIELFGPKEGRRNSYLKGNQKKKSINVSKTSNEVNQSAFLGKQKTINTVNDNADNAKYEFIDNTRLRNIFENYKLANKKNKKLGVNEYSLSRSISHNKSDSNEKNNSSINNRYIYNLFDSLNYQDKHIKAIKKNERKVISLSKLISKKINKEEDDLLINKVDLFKFKKEIINGINDEKPKEQKFGKFQWNMDLRKPHNFRGLKQLYVNVNSEKNPFWGVIVDRCPEIKEKAIRPGYNLNLKEFQKFAKNQNIQKSQKCLNSIKNLDDLSVNGNNLLDLEFKREMSTKGRKILHKFFVENGKYILDKDINNIFGEETIYKNYDNRYSHNYTYENEPNNFEDKNYHYKFNQKEKKSRIASSMSKSLDKSGSNSNIYNNMKTLQNDF